MKKYLLGFCLLFIFLPGLSAQQTDYRVVFDLTSRDSLDHKAVIRWLSEISNSSPQANMEVVMYGQGLSLVVRGRTTFEEAVTKLGANKNITFKVCAIAMKNQGIDPSQLLPAVQVVPDGIYEIISKQREGWGYIKAVH